MTAAPWLTVIGLALGEADLPPAARAALAQAEIIVSAARHHAILRWARPEAQQWNWQPSLPAVVARILAARGQRVVVLATGDPLWFGVGATLASHIEPVEMRVLPAVGAFSQAAARLLWPLDQVRCLTVHGRALASIRRHLSPGARLLILSHDRRTPGECADLLTESGYGASSLTALSCMGAAGERIICHPAHAWRAAVHGDAVDDLNTLAVLCEADTATTLLGRGAGLPDTAFIQDGMITRRALRAAALAHLVPRPQTLLWDVGAGAGSVAIEWLRLGESARAVAIEQNPARLQLIAQNAQALGTPELVIIEGRAPQILESVAARFGPPDALFLGGGVGEGGGGAEGMVAACLSFLRPGGQLVAHAVTLAGEQALVAAYLRWGGELTRFQTSRAGPLGANFAWSADRPVTQWALTGGMG